MECRQWANLECHQWANLECRQWASLECILLTWLWVRDSLACTASVEAERNFDENLFNHYDDRASETVYSVSIQAAEVGNKFDLLREDRVYFSA